MNIKRKEWVNCLPPNVLRDMIKLFPNYRPGSWRYHPYGVGPLLAYVLYMAGVKTLNFSTSRVAGDKTRPENLQIHTNSLIATPYIKGPDGTPLLLYLIRKAKIETCGGGAAPDQRKSWMQAGLSFSILNDKETENQMLKAYLTFQYLKEHFPR